MPDRFAGATVALALAALLQGCAAHQAGENTVEMANTISRIREIQVLRNVGAAISDHDMVPSQITLGTGQASVQMGVSPSLKLPHFDFSKAGKELDVGATDTWSAQWQFQSVTNADDLRRLRNLYALIASTDAQYDALEAFFANHRDMKITNDDETPKPDASRPNDSGLKSLLQEVLPSKSAAAHGGASQEYVVGNGPGSVLPWQTAADILENGDSIDCKLYQAAPMPGGDDGKGLPFRRWLYWRADGGAWLPETPESEPTSMGHYGDWEIGVTSRACFDDFVILMQGVTPAADASGAQGAKVMLSQ